MKSKIRRVAPWIGTAAVLAFLFSRVSFTEVIAKVSEAAWWAAPAVVGCMLLMYLGDSLAIWKTFSWFVAPLTYRQTLTLRGATYLFAWANYALGQGAFVYFLHRSQKVPVLRGAAAVLLIMGINLLVLLISSTIGLALGADMPAQLRAVIIAGNLGLVIYAIVVAAKPDFLVRRAVFEILLAAGIVGHLKALVVRIPHLVALLLLNFGALHAFGVHIPLVAALTYLPMVLLIAVIPISVQGIGPTQGAMAFFFSRFADGATPGEQAAAVLAASLSAQVIATCVQILLGMICVRSELVRDLKQDAKENPAGA